MDTLLSKKNVLEVEYDSTAFKVGMLIIFFAAITTIPLLMLPAKNDVEAIVFNNKTMTTCQNIIVTVCLCSICAILAIWVPQISDVITVLGCTIVPLSGFLFPAIFFLKIYSKEENKNWKLKLEIVLWWTDLVFITIISTINLILFIISKTN